MPLQRGNVVDVTISGIHRGQAGAPGELRGYFGTGKRGTLLGNTACGVFGIYRELPEGFDTTAYPVGTRDQIHEGEATVLCTLASNERHSYTVRLSAIDKGADAIVGHGPHLLRADGRYRAGHEWLAHHSGRQNRGCRHPRAHQQSRHRLWHLHRKYARADGQGVKEKAILPNGDIAFFKISKIYRHMSKSVL